MSVVQDAGRGSHVFHNRGMTRLLALLFLVCAVPVGAQDYPSRPIHIIVPYTPGTGADILSRLLGPKLGERWKAPVVTDNKAGATANLAAEYVAKSAPAGHTLLLAAPSFPTPPPPTPPLPLLPPSTFPPLP